MTLLLELFCGRRCVSVYLVNKFASSSAMQMFYILLSNSMCCNITTLASFWMFLRDSHLEFLDYPGGDSHLKLQDQSHKNQWSILSKFVTHIENHLFCLQCCKGQYHLKGDWSTHVLLSISPLSLKAIALEISSATSNKHSRKA